jgi:hypothetical protein
MSAVTDLVRFPDDGGTRPNADSFLGTLYQDRY